MVRAFHEVYDMAQEQKSHLRTGAYLLSVKRVADAMLEEWSRTKKAPQHAAWVHEKARKAMQQ